MAREIAVMLIHGRRLSLLPRRAVPAGLARTAGEPPRPAIPRYHTLFDVRSADGKLSQNIAAQLFRRAGHLDLEIEGVHQLFFSNVSYLLSGSLTPAEVYAAYRGLLENYRTMTGPERMRFGDPLYKRMGGMNQADKARAVAAIDGDWRKLIAFIYPAWFAAEIPAATL